jgi:hypothetical protein
MGCPLGACVPPVGACVPPVDPCDPDVGEVLEFLALELHAATVKSNATIPVPRKYLLALLTDVTLPGP